MPTIFIINEFRFYFYSHENDEPIHVHIVKGDANGKVWLEPEISIAYMHGFKVKEIKQITEIINEELITLKKNGMNTSVNKYDSIENIIFKENLKITSIDFSISLDKMYVQLSNEHSFVVPTKMYKRLTNVSEKSIKNYQIIASGTGIHWPDLDEDLSLKGFFKDFLVQQIHSEKELVLVN